MTLFLFTLVFQWCWIGCFCIFFCSYLRFNLRILKCSSVIHLLLFKVLQMCSGMNISHYMLIGESLIGYQWSRVSRVFYTAYYWCYQLLLNVYCFLLIYVEKENILVVLSSAGPHNQNHLLIFSFKLFLLHFLFFFSIFSDQVDY